MLVLGDREVQSLLGDLSAPQCLQLLDALSQTLADYSSSSSSSSSTNGPPLVHQPMRQVFTTAAGHTSLFMPASNTRTTGIKIVTLPGHGGAPRGAINVFSPSGELTGLLNAEEITAFRTALASMVPLLRFPLPPPPQQHGTRLVVFGAGKQAEWHVRLAALLLPSPALTVTVVNRGAASLDRLGRKLRDRCPGLDIRLVAKEGRAPAAYEEDLRAALRDCDAVMCCTPATEPLFPASYLAAAGRKRRFLSLIGSYKPSMQEVDADTLLSGAGARVYVDSREACLAEAGEIIRAKVPGDRLVELGEALAANHDFAADAEEGNVVFKCVGMGIMDVVVAAGLLDIAREKGVGRTIEDF
ncbi:proline utilization protein PrnX [Biscogniauxia sp. FL1348]|nr:proline utilization protein PrnX [Biscogniauxia sp. FL1348]